MEEKEYFIHDNGARPYMVCVTQVVKDDQKCYNVDVYLESGIDENSGNMKYNTVPEYIFNVEEVFEGEGTLLLKIGKREYVCVYGHIIEFETKEEVIEYYSPIVANDVPYPYAIDNKFNYYLLLENVIYSNSLVDYKTLVEENIRVKCCPYRVFYDENNITTLNKKSIIINNFMDIDKFYIKEGSSLEEYKLSFVTNPSDDYDRIRKNIGEPYIKKIGQEIMPLTKDEYIEISTEYGSLMGYQALQYNKLQG